VTQDPRPRSRTRVSKVAQEAGAPVGDGRTPGLPGAGGGRLRPRMEDREALALAHRIVDLAADRKAADIVLLSVAEQTTLTDYFVICSGGSERQLGAIVDGIVEGLKAEGHQPIGREGSSDAHWLLLDYGAVIVHVMAWPEREFYALEKLWSEAPLLLRVQ
jgi:ribosome-associated protein